MMTLSLSRRGLVGSAAATGAATLLPAGSHALTQTAAGGSRVVAYTRKIGEVEITTLLDGHFLLEQAWLSAIDPDEIVEGLGNAFLDPTAPVPLPITAYLVRAGGRLTLIDAGAGGSLGPTAGRLADMLAGVGVAPGAVDRLVVSHLHPDHIGGALTGDAASFPNATLHVSGTELAFWTNPANATAVPEAIRPWFDLAGKVIGAYGQKVRPFEGEADLGGGVSVVPMPGHTPGHSGFRVSSGSAQALLWGDSTSVASLQFTHPEAGIVFDTDSQQGAATRRRVLDMVVTDKTLVSGTHLPFPGFGHVEERDGAYAWVPEEWKLF